MPMGRSSDPISLLGGLKLGPGKPEHIFAQTGRLPAFAGGNADVDIEMLTCATFALLVNHDDADREFAYIKAAERALVKAERLGWTVVSMRNDWTTVFKDRRRCMSDLTAIVTRLNPRPPRSVARPAARRMIRAATPASRIQVT
jgi:hypothetical protein